MLLYYYYLGLILWVMMTFVILCILAIEFRTYCYHLCLRSILQKIVSYHDSQDPTSRDAKTNRSDPNQHYYQKPTYMFPLLSYLFYLITGIFGITSNFSNENMCYWASLIPSISYPLGKMWMYLVFLYRLNMVYRDTEYEYNRKFIIAMVSIVILYSLIFMVAISWSISPYITHINQDIILCGANYPFGMYLFVVLFDIITNSICCYLFVKPLFLLSKNDETNNSHGIYNVALRCVILTFVAVVSTVIILLLIAISGLTAMIPIDIAINCIVIMLLNKTYSKQYYILCCGFIKLCSLCFPDKHTKTKDSKPAMTVKATNSEVSLDSDNHSTVTTQTKEKDVEFVLH